MCIYNLFDDCRLICGCKASRGFPTVSGISSITWSEAARVEAQTQLWLLDGLRECILRNKSSWTHAKYSHTQTESYRVFFFNSLKVAFHFFSFCLPTRIHKLANKSIRLERNSLAKHDSESRLWFMSCVYASNKVAVKRLYILTSRNKTQEQ